jgi:hypothetical protein
VTPLADGGQGHLSLAGWWRLLVSQPLVNALLAVWLWRMLLWTRFIAGVARMDLRLVAAHPDWLGGLRFTLLPIRSFAFVAFGIGAIAAGTVTESVLVDGVPLGAFRMTVITQVVFVIALFAGPSLFWRRPLIRLKSAGTLAYGRLAARMGRTFERRWLAANREVDAKALEAGDFSATTDLYSIVANVGNINLRVLDGQLLAVLAVATLLPYVPVVLAVMPLEEVLRFALKALA